MKNFNYLNQHKFPISRREFISRGLVTAGAVITTPTLLGFLTQSARAETISGVMPKFITFDLSGGAALFANFLVGGAGGASDLLPSYDMMGWDPRAAGAIDGRFGLPMPNSKISQLMQGLTASASTAAQANFRMSSLLHIGQTDSSTNPLSIVNLVAQARLTQGSDMVGPTGLIESISGGNSASIVDIAAYRPFYISDVDSLFHSVGVMGALQGFSNPQISAMGKLLNRLSQTQLNGFLSGSLDVNQRKAIVVRI